MSVADFVLDSTPGGFKGALMNNTPILTRCEVTWAVNLVNITVMNYRITEEASYIHFHECDGMLREAEQKIDTLYFEAPSLSMSLSDRYSTTGRSTFGVDNVTSSTISGQWQDIVRSSHVLSLIDRDRTKTMPWFASNNISQYIHVHVDVLNQLLQRKSSVEGGGIVTATGKVRSTVFI